MGEVDEHEAAFGHTTPQINRRRAIVIENCLVPCIRADRTCFGFSTKLCIIIYNFAH